MILTDTFVVENVQLVNESRGGKTVPVLRGTFGRCDEKNNNGRVYSKVLLEREVKKIAEAMTERRLLGELDHPSHDSVKLNNVSHLITNLSFKGNELVGECELLNTPSGKVAQALVEGGVKVGISSRGMGTLSEGADGTKTVNEDFKLVTFDLVADPSTRGAFPGVSESTQSNLVEEIVKDTLDKAAREKIFTTLLKDKLREKAATFGSNNAPFKVDTPLEAQKKADKKPPKPTVEDPMKNWEYFYGYNTGKPKLMRTRSYDDAETVTAPAEVTENKFSALKNILSETKISKADAEKMVKAGSVSRGKSRFSRIKASLARQGLLGSKAAVKAGAEHGASLNPSTRNAPYNKTPDDRPERREGNYGSGYSTRTQGRRSGDTK